jgi:hypothetical protein
VSRAVLLLVPALIVGVAVGVLGERRRHPPAVQLQQPEPHTIAAAPQQQSRDCTAELNMARVKLAICMAYQPQQTAERPAEDAALRPAQQWEAEEVESVRRYQKVLREHKEVVIVRRADNSVDAFPVGEPIPDGIIVGRRLANGEMGWYTGTGSREDPASFEPADRSHLKPPVFRTKDEINAASAASAAAAEPTKQ